jgi:serine/threonine-protein kinase RsbW
LAVVELEVPPRSVYVGVVRLAVSALGRSIDLDEDEIEDLKIAVSEACANAVIGHEAAGIPDPVKITWNDDDARIEIAVVSKGKRPVDMGEEALTTTGSLASRDVLSLALLQSLVEECTVEDLPAGGSVTRLVVSPS